jgi:micrococcal nuclease
MVLRKPFHAIGRYTFGMWGRHLGYLFFALFALLAISAAMVGAIDMSTGRTMSSPNVAAPVYPAATTPDTYFVTKVVDGDTIDIFMRGKTVRLRLIGLDTPETVDPRKPVQCFGEAASAEAKKLLTDQWVRIETDPSQGTLDKYGRTLAYVFLPDGTNYEEYMIAEGYGHEYTYDLPYTYQAEFKAAERNAREEKKGLWADDTCAGNTAQPAARG